MSRIQCWWAAAAVCLAVGGCDQCGAQGHAPRPVASNAPETRAEPEPEPEPEPRRAAEQPALSPLPPAPNPPGEEAYAHFDAAGQASRAILAADLPAAAPHLAWLAHYQYPEKLPEPWRAHAARLQLAARVIARAESVSEALRALPTLHAACGSCHAALANVDFNATQAPTGHGDGAIALLQALSGEADVVFLRALWATPRVVDKKADPAALKQLSDACERAKRVPSWVERQSATEAIYGLCGSCHAQYR